MIIEICSLLVIRVMLYPLDDPFMAARDKYYYWGIGFDPLPVNPSYLTQSEGPNCTSGRHPV